MAEVIGFGFGHGGDFVNWVHPGRFSHLKKWHDYGRGCQF
jgi:hypothetical protein